MEIPNDAQTDIAETADIFKLLSQTESIRTKIEECQAELEEMKFNANLSENELKEFEFYINGWVAFLEKLYRQEEAMYEELDWLI